MIKLADVLEANRVLVALGGEDQMQRIAAASIERSLELQNRIERALAYAAQTPANSAHARQIARILDGSITVDDELNEVEEHDRPIRLALHHEPAQKVEPVSSPAVRKTRGPGKTPRAKGLAGRSTKQRKEFREWLAQSGYEVTTYGPVPQHLIDEYDASVENGRKARVAARKAEREGQLPM